MEESPNKRCGSAYDHVCPTVITLGAMSLYFMDIGKARWSTAAREASDEILRLRIEREWLRMMVRLLSRKSESTDMVRKVLGEFLEKIDSEDRTDGVSASNKKYRNASFYGAGPGRLGRLMDGDGEVFQ